MAYTTEIPGVPGGPIQTSFPVKMKIAPAWRTNVRPGISARRPRLPVQHETANPRSMAVDDATYLYNGSGGRQASWHMTVDDIEAYIGIPLDEVTWQASDGAGPGNYNGISCELAVKTEIVNNNGRRAQSQKNAAEIMGVIGARLDATPPAKRHYDYAPNKKWCPAQMLNRNEWNRYVDWWRQFYNEEKARMAGEPVSGKFDHGDTVQVTAEPSLTLRQGSGRSYRAMTQLAPGTVATIIDGPRHADGFAWWDIKGDFGTGWVADGHTGVPYLEKTTAPKPEEPAPTYAKPLPIDELLMTDLKKYDTAPGIRTRQDETDFIFVADVIQFTDTTRAHQWAGEAAPPIRADFHKGERAIAAWLVEAADGYWYYVLSGGDDEWARVRYDNTVRVSDAPLLGDGVE